MRDLCVYCYGVPMGLDHIVPKSKGGTDGWPNRAPACVRCDSSRQATPMLLFILERGGLVPDKRPPSERRVNVKARNRALNEGGHGPKPIVFKRCGLELSVLLTDEWLPPPPSPRADRLTELQQEAHSGWQ